MNNNSDNILYKFYWDCGRNGEISGLFVSTHNTIQQSIGKNVYFGEVLGKHSEIYGTLDISDITIMSTDQQFIDQLLQIFDAKNSGTIIGYNPLAYMDEMEYDDEECEDNDC